MYVAKCTTGWYSTQLTLDVTEEIRGTQRYLVYAEMAYEFRIDNNVL